MKQTSHIEKISLGNGRWEYRILGNFGEIARYQIALPILATLFFGVMNGILWFISGIVNEMLARPIFFFPFLLFLFPFLIALGGLSIVLHHIWGKTILTFSPQWIRIKYELFGFGLTQRVPTSAVISVNIVNRYFIGEEPTMKIIQGINLRTGRKTLHFGSHLPFDEKRWIVAEIKAFLAMVSAPYEISELDARVNITNNAIEIAFSRFSTSWPFYTKEIIAISGDTLTLRDTVLGRGRAQHFKLKEIGNLRVAEKGFSDGTLLFDYYQTPITFARNLSVAEAATLCKQLNGILTFRYQVVEQIVFGEMPPAFIGTPETLLINPDVSDLSFPFIRLQRLILDAATHDPRRVERFLTYAVNAIGQRKLKESVDVHIYGDPAQLQANMRNNFDNLFRRVEQHDIL